VDKTLKKAQDMNSTRISNKKISEDLTKDKKYLFASQGENLNIIKTIKKRNCTGCNNCHSSVDKTPPATQQPAAEAGKKKFPANFLKGKMEKIQKDLRSSISPFLKKKVNEDSRSTNVTPTVVRIYNFLERKTCG
jgi:hypothetical protein